VPRIGPGRCRIFARSSAEIAKEHRLERGDFPGGHRRHCVRCGTRFYAVRSDAQYCSDRCAYRVHVETRRQRRAESRSERPCQLCGVLFKPARSDAAYCSPRCRQASYRKRCGG
jgi:predicted nucleic acid-binding Zn ribbon protein